MVLEHIIERIGFSVCHQISDRSLALGETVIPLCARCHGLYMGFFVATALLFILYRKREAALPSVWVIVIFLVFISSTLLDGSLSYLGITSTNNNIRFVTGFLCMASIAAILYPVFIFQYFKRTLGQRILSKGSHFLLFMGILSVIVILHLARFGFLSSTMYYLSAFSLIFTFFFINLTVVLLLPPFSKKASRLFSRYLLLPSILAIMMTGFELYIFYLVRLAAERAFY